MRILQVFSGTYGCDVQLTFNEADTLIKYEVVNPAAQAKDMIRLCTNLADFMVLMEQHKMKVIEVQRVITFEMMWVRYNYKVDKALALAYWRTMPAYKQILAYDGEPAYTAQCKANNISRKYLVRYLKHEPFMQ